MGVIDKEQWRNISDSNTKKLVRNLQRTEMYRCIVSNGVGRTVSDVSTVTFTGKSFIYQY